MTKKIKINYQKIRNLFGRSVGLDDFFDVVLGSHDDRNPLVDVFGCDFHDTLCSCGGNTSCLFHDEGHGSSLIQQSKLSINIFGVTRVSENTSVQQSTVDITHHGSDVSAGEFVSGLSSSVLPSGDDLLKGFVPHVCVGLVEGQDGASFGDLQVGVAQDKFSKVFIEGESIGTGTEGQNKEGRGRIQAVCSSDQVGSCLKGVAEATQFFSAAILSDTRFVHGAVFIVFVDSNDGSGGDTGIDVRGSIQGIENSNVFVGFGKDSFFIGVDKIELIIYRKE
jgi:hypothetical protein